VEASRNIARWNAEAGAGWMEYARAGSPVFGAALLGGQPDFQVAIENRLAGNWDDADKISRMQEGLSNPSATEPDDYSQLIGAAYSGGDFTAAFVVAAGGDAQEFLNNVTVARARWNGRQFGRPSPAQPQGIQLLSAYPSPFNGTFKVLFRTDVGGWVDWRLYDLSGRALPLGGGMTVPVGRAYLPLALPGMPSGRYLLELRQNDNIIQIPATLLR